MLGSRLHYRRSLAPLAFLTLAITACVAPTTQLSPISPAELEAEQLKQQQLVIRNDVRDQQRIEDVGYPLLAAALPMCGPGATTTRPGLRYANIHSFSKQYQPAARALGFTDTLTVVGVTRGSAAERGGIKIGDRLVGIGEAELTPARDAVLRAKQAFDRVRNLDAGFPLVVQHGPSALTVAAPRVDSVVLLAPERVSITLPADTLCDYTLTAIKDDMLNAWADGRGVFVTSAMMRFAGTDDELATVIAHEIAHNAMKHMDAKSKNAGIGAIFGAILDVAAATQGVNTGGGFTKDLAAIASQTFSQDFEREADYVGMYILARAGRPFASAADFWRRMAQENPGSIKFASSHPTTAERYLRLEQAATEIQGKQSGGAPLVPEAKKK